MEWLVSFIMIVVAFVIGQVMGKASKIRENNQTWPDQAELLLLRALCVYKVQLPYPMVKMIAEKLIEFVNSSIESEIRSKERGERQHQEPLNPFHQLNDMTSFAVRCMTDKHDQSKLDTIIGEQLTASVVNHLKSKKY